MLGCAYGALLCLCLLRRWECSVIPDLLENLLFQPSMLVHGLLFFCEEYSIFLFSPPLCLEKGPPFPDFPTASLESERRSGKLDRRRVTPQCPASFTPHELKHPGLKALELDRAPRQFSHQHQQWGSLLPRPKPTLFKSPD